MEELYMPSNDGELSFVETDGNIVLEQGCQGYISSVDQTTQNVIYSQPAQIQEQVYIIQHTPIQAAEPHQQQFTYRNISNTPAYNHITYTTGQIGQSQQQQQVLQPVQQGINRNDEFSIIQEISQPQPQPQRVVHIVPPEQSLQVSNIVQIPIQQHQQQRQIPVQKQIQRHSVPQQFIVQKLQNTRQHEDGKSQVINQPFNVSGFQQTGDQQITLALQSPSSSVSSRPQRPQLQRMSFNLRAQNTSQTNSPYGPRMVRPSAHHSRPTLSNNVSQEAYLKQLEQRTNSPGRGRSRGNKSSVVQQRRIYSQQLASSSVSSNSEISSLQFIKETEKKDQEMEVENINSEENSPNTPLHPRREAVNQEVTEIVNSNEQKLPQIGQLNSFSKRISSNQFKSKVEEELDGRQTHLNTTVDTSSAGQTGKPLMLAEKSGERMAFSQSQGNKLIFINDGKLGKMLVLPSVCRSSNLSTPSQLSFQNSKVASENQQKLIYIKDSGGMTELGKKNNQEVVPIDRIEKVDELRTVGVSGKSLSVNVTLPQSFKKCTPDSLTALTKPKETLTLCTHCGIQTESLMFCSSCKHPIAKNIVARLSTTVSDAQTSTTYITTAGNSKNNNNNQKINLSSSITSKEFYSKYVMNSTRLTQSEKKAPTATRGRGGRGRGRGRTKTYEEPVILTLSSDDEEESNGSSSKNQTASGINTEKSATAQVNSRVGLSSTIPPSITTSAASPTIWNRINKKEPLITSEMDETNDISSVTTDGMVRHQSLLAQERGVMSEKLKMPLSLKCRSIRIGSYKVVPVDAVEIKHQDNIKMIVPPFIQGETDPVSITISFMSIVGILGHFGNSLPVLFLYLIPRAAEEVRRKLKMTDKNRYYYDPGSSEESQKRITILPERIDDDSRRVLKELLNIEKIVKGMRKNIFCELDQKEANEILVQSSPQEIQSLIRKSGMKLDCETITLLIYPPPPNKGGITITTDDYCCLEEEQFLNDVIIDFYLKWLMVSRVKEVDRERTHVFSTFFYKRLTSKPKNVRRVATSSEDDSKLSPAQKRHARVQSWTKHVDIFSKDFILIPINEHSHWFLAVICFPGLDGPVRASDGTPVPKLKEKVQKAPSSKPKVKVEIPVIEDVEWSDRDEAEGDDDELEDNDEEETSSSKLTKEGSECSDSNKRIAESLSVDGDEAGRCNIRAEQNEECIKQPCILIFDSLSGASRCRIVATLRDYLTVEYAKKKKKEKIFNKDTMKGACPKVPQQMNFSDCGLFTLQFAQSFFETPVKNFRLPIRTLVDWFDQDVVARKREYIANLIKSLMDKYKPDHGIQLPSLRFNSDKDRISPSRSPTRPVDSIDSKSRELPEEYVSKRDAESNRIQYEELINDISSSASKKININLINKVASSGTTVGEPHSQSNLENLRSSSNLHQVDKNSAVFDSSAVTLSNVSISEIYEDEKKIIFSNSSCNSDLIESVTVNGCGALKDSRKPPNNNNNNNKANTDPRKESSEEDIIGKSPGRIEIRDEDTSEVLLIFNPSSSNSEDISQVTEINIESSPSTSASSQLLPNAAGQHSHTSPPLSISSSDSSLFLSSPTSEERKPFKTASQSSVFSRPEAINHAVNSTTINDRKHSKILSSKLQQHQKGNQLSISQRAPVSRSTTQISLGVHSGCNKTGIQQQQSKPQQHHSLNDKFRDTILYSENEDCESHRARREIQLQKMSKNQQQLLQPQTLSSKQHNPRLHPQIKDHKQQHQNILQQQHSQWKEVQIQKSNTRLDCEASEERLKETDEVKRQKIVYSNESIEKNLPQRMYERQQRELTLLSHKQQLKTDISEGNMENSLIKHSPEEEKIEETKSFAEAEKESVEENDERCSRVDAVHHQCEAESSSTQMMMMHSTDGEGKTTTQQVERDSTSSTFLKDSPAENEDSKKKTSFVSAPCIPTTIPLASPSSTSSRTTSRGRIVNTPIKYRDLEDFYGKRRREKSSVRTNKFVKY